VILVSETQEIGVGELQYRQVLSQSVVNQNMEANRLVRKVGRRLAQAANHPAYSWEFVVLDGPETIHAWVSPGGKVGVYTGLFPIADDETGLAILLAHEIAHALARHHGEKTSHDVFMEVGSMGVTFAPDLLRQGYNLGTNLGLILPFGQAQEIEADALGLRLAAKAGYDPSSAWSVWTRLNAEVGKRPQPPAFLLAHPEYDLRRQTIAQWLPEALRYYQPNPAEKVEKLPPLASLEPLDEEEKALLQAMGTLDRIAMSTPEGKVQLITILTQESRLPAQTVEEAARDSALRPGELAYALVLAQQSETDVRTLVTLAEQTRSWSEVAHRRAVAPSVLTQRLQEIAEAVQGLGREPEEE
jgi:hypothetical protein